MLPAKNRLHNKKEFQEVLKMGAKLFGQMVMIRYIANTSDFKMGLIVSTKVAKNASDRNRIKRLIREVVRREFLKENKFCRMVIIARKEIVDKDYDQIKMELKKILKKQGF